MSSKKSTERSFKILLVNDEPFQTILMQTQLNTIKGNLEIITAINGDQAVRTIQDNMLEFYNY